VRYAPAALATTMLVLASERPVSADGVPTLWLSRADALRVIDGRAVRRPPEAIPRTRPFTSLRRLPGALPAPPSFIPDSIDLEDQYALDVERDLPRFASPVEKDEHVGFELLRMTPRRPGLQLVWDEEDPVIGEGSNKFSLRMQFRF